MYFSLEKLWSTAKMTEKIPNLDQIPNVLGYMVLDEDQIITVIIVVAF